jgi:heat shock protein HtpX
MYTEIARNKRKTFYIMFAFVLLVGGLGWLASEYFIGSSSLMPFILIGSLIYVLISYFTGAKTALAVNGAKEISKQDDPRLWRIVENLAITEGLPMPKVYIMNDPALNAFATGRDPKHAAVCATTGILEALNDTELEGVMAHELGHVKNYDIRVSMVAFALVVVIGFIADMLLHATFFRDSDDNGGGNAFMLILGIIAGLLAPLVASLIQLAISRRREYLADATGALATRYPEGLASALEKISQGGSTLRRQNSSTAHLFFANPLSKGAIAGLFSTHPPVKERVARLRNMGNAA